MMNTTALHRGLVSVCNYHCRALRGDEPYVEVHGHHTLSYVRKGAFGYRVRGALHELVTGSVLVGHPGEEYSCTHDHAQGDECLSFHLAPELVGQICDRTGIWRTACLPPLSELVVLGELAHGSATGRSDVDPEEAGLLFAARFAEVVTGATRRASGATPRDRRRAVEAAMWMEMRSREAIDLAQVASEAGLSAWHFLRVFNEVLGVTPHQYLVRSRLREAARLLADDARSITDVALEVGFGDVSNFVRTFRRAAGASPGGFRNLARGDRGMLRERMTAPLVLRRGSELKL